MKIAVVTFDGFNEIDSIVAAHILNRVERPGWKAEITAPNKTVTSMNGVTISAQRSLEFLDEADAIIFGSGRKTRQMIEDNSIMSRIKVSPRRQLVASQCSGALILAHLGLLQNIPACTDVITRPELEGAGVSVIEAPFYAQGNIASAGGCLSAQYLATWIIWRLVGKDAAIEALSYVVPVGQEEEYISRAIRVVAEYIEKEQYNSKFGQSSWSQLLRSAAERAIRYRDNLGERRVAPLPESVAKLSELGGALPEQPTDGETILSLLDEIGSPATVNMAGGRYFGFVNGSSLPATLAANWLAGAWDQNASLSVMSPVAIALEEIALGWLLDVLGLPAQCSGAFVTGATMANFTGLAAARHFVLKNAGWDVEARGLFGAPPITVVVGAEVHPTLLKSLGLLGLGRDRVLIVPTDGQGRMRDDALPELSGPTIVCIQAGNVNTGAFDPAREICALAHRADAWVHVDGAFGLWAAASPGRAHLMDGFAEADSWATDGHKWLNVPYDSGLAFVRHAEALRAAMSLSAAYLPSGDAREPMHYTPEASRRARGVEVWAALRALGRTGLAELTERTCRHAARFAAGFRHAGYRVLNDVLINQVLVSLGDEETTRRVIAAIQEDGTCWCGGTNWQGQPAMRISVSSWATTEADVERSLTAMLRIAAQENTRQVIRA